MGIGVSTFLIALGAILTFAISTAVEGVNLEAVGVILMIVGGIGLLWSLLVWGPRRGGVDTMERRTVVREDPI